MYKYLILPLCRIAESDFSSLHNGEDQAENVSLISNLLLPANNANNEMNTSNDDDDDAR